MTVPSYQPPPDVSGYTDLRIYDVTDQQIVDTALAAAQLNMPEWTPHEGHTEVLLIEALALELAEGIVAINRLPGATLETLLRFAGVGRDFGAAPRAFATINCADELGHSIPGGTRLYAPTADGSSVVVMLVEPPGAEIPQGSDSATVSIIGDTFTSAANGVPAETMLQMITPLAFVDSVELGTPITDGRNPESDEEWRDRGVNRLGRLSEALVLPKHFEAAALEDPGVARVVVVDNNDPTTGGVGDDPGHITVAVLGEGGVELSSEAKADLADALSDQALAMLAVHVTDLAVTAVDLEVEIHLSDASDPDAVVAAVETAITDYLNPLTWSYGTTLRRNELISLVDQVPGVDYVGTVTITGQDGSGNLPMPTASTVPDAGDITVTVI